MANAALLWDESFLWGLMAHKALKADGLPFDLIRSEDIRRGQLKNYKLLFVPGGWASNKLKALGDAGVNDIKNFVQNGGNYLGFCGGAGLATLDGIGLLNIKRKPTKERVPSFSGRIHLNTNDHPIWSDLQKSEARSQRSEIKNPESNLSPVTRHSSLVFHAWWPSQFLISGENIKLLATYGNALPDSFSSDLNVGDVNTSRNWKELEWLYQINLNPERLLNEPAVVEGFFGKGKVILSLVHFDTPDDTNGARVLRHLWNYLESPEARKSGSSEGKEKNLQSKEASALHHFRASCLISELEAAVEEMISLGIRNFLWFWRNPMLLQWRRGVRGLEYCTLYVMMKEIVEIVRSQRAEIRSLKSDLDRIKELLIPFVEKTKQLLVMERFAMQNNHITYEKCDNPEIQEIRAEIFGNSKSHGGLFKKLIDEVDSLLYALLIQTSQHETHMPTSRHKSE